MIAPPSKPVVVHRILCMEQVLRLAEIDLKECTEWMMKNTTGWRGSNDVYQHDNNRIRVSKNKEIDDEVAYQHEIYKATGSILAQARIDCFIIPCIVYQLFGQPYSGGEGNNYKTMMRAMRNRIPGYLWKEMTAKTDISDVLQYHTLPDLGVYIRSRMISSSVFVPTCGSSSSPQQEYYTSSSLEAEVINNNNTKIRKRGGGRGNKRQKYLRDSENIQHASSNSLGSVLAFSHSCCPSSTPRARQDADNDCKKNVKKTTDSKVAIPESCTSMGCLHGSIISLLLGSVMPLCKRLSQCRRLYATHPQVRSAVSCCTLMEYTIICSLLQALFLGLYPRYPPSHLPFWNV